MINDITQAMRNHGIICNEPIIADGDIHRFANNSKGNQDCWYVLFQNGGAFGDWSKNLNHSWTSGNQDLSDAERRALVKQIEEETKRREAGTAERQEEAAKQAAQRWGSLSLTGTSPYLDKKQVQPYGVRFDGQSIIVPLRDAEGKLWSLQTIFADGQKRFFAGGKKKGCFHTIGDLSTASEIYVCEGYATATSVYEATGTTTIVAFDAGSLAPVIEEVRAKYPDLSITIAADNDQWKEVNAGKNNAEEVAQRYGCHVILPQFPDAVLAQKPTDFNDLHVLCGIDAVKAQLTNQPKEKTYPLPEGFNFTKEGLCFEDQWVCSPLEVLAYTRDENSENWGRLVRFLDLDTKPHTHAIPMELLSGDCTELYGLLLSSGLKINTQSRSRSKLTNYLQSYKTDKRALCTPHIGWHGRYFVLPGGTIPETDTIYLQSDNSNFSGYRIAGTLEEWQIHVAAPCRGNSRLIFALSCAFASPLLPLVGAESGGFNLIGASSIGKSTALSVAASVWGSPKYIHQWKTTGNALEAVAEAHNHALLCLDELGQVDGKEAGSIAYMLANGSGKNRLKARGGLRKKFEWKTLFLSTGEISITAKINEAGMKAQAGMVARLADVPADAGTGHRLFDTVHEFKDGSVLAKHLKDHAGRHYGTAICAYLQSLCAIQDQLSEAVKSVQADFVSQNLAVEADGQVKRVAERFALVAAAGELAIDLHILPYEPGEAFAAVAACFKSWLKARGSSESFEVEEAVARVQAFIEENHSSRFASMDKADSSFVEVKVVNQAGYKKLTDEGVYEFFLFPGVFENEICKGLNAAVVKDALAKRDYLYRDSNGKYTKPIKLPGQKGKKRMIHLAPAIFLGAEE